MRGVRSQGRERVGKGREENRGGEGRAERKEGERETGSRERGKEDWKGEERGGGRESPELKPQKLRKVNRDKQANRKRF